MTGLLPGGVRIGAIGITYYPATYKLSFPQKGLPHLRTLLFHFAAPCSFFFTLSFFKSQFIDMYLLYLIFVYLFTVYTSH